MNDVYISVRSDVENLMDVAKLAELERKIKEPLPEEE
jgi:hypothetical protein